jgi:hypothetical protein
LAFLGIFPPSTGASEQTGVRRTEAIAPSAPRPKTVLPPSPTEQSAPKSPALRFTIRRSPRAHKPSRTGSQLRPDPLWWLKNFKRVQGVGAVVVAAGATLVR